jgi:hypothetical protein
VTRTISRGCALLVRRELHPVDRQHRVEAVVLERQVLCVGLQEVGFEAVRIGAHPGAVEQRRHVVDAGHLAVAACRHEGCGAAAAGDVEHPFAGMQLAGVAACLGHHDVESGDLVEVSL